jgi:hypothetical protein
VEERDDLHPDTPDTAALRRRVLLTAVLALGLYVVALLVLDAFQAPAVYAVLAIAVIYVFVVRPLMRPVRAAIALRRRLAYQAWLDARDDDAGGAHG